MNAVPVRSKVYEAENREDTPAAWLSHCRYWRKEYDFTLLREEAIARTCPHYSTNKVIYPRYCLECEDCVGGYEFLCIKCGKMASYAGANILDMLCKKCFDRICG